MNTHWLDAFSVSLTRDGSRRVILGTASRLALGFVLGDTTAALAGGKKKNKKGNKGKHDHKPKPKPKPKPTESCSERACAVEPAWAGNQEQIDYCELMCQQCDGGDPRDFCILDAKKPDGTPTKVADCCNLAAPNCCNGKCTNFRDDKKNCGICGNACGDGQICRDHKCVCLDSCPHGQLCLEASGQTCRYAADSNCRCGCGPIYKYCPNLNGGACVSPNAVC